MSAAGAGVVMSSFRLLENGLSLGSDDLAWEDEGGLLIPRSSSRMTRGRCSG